VLQESTVAIQTSLAKDSITDGVYESITVADYDAIADKE
jgi:hypothetical protein